VSASAQPILERPQGRSGLIRAKDMRELRPRGHNAWRRKERKGWPWNRSAESIQAADVLHRGATRDRVHGIPTTSPKEKELGGLVIRPAQETDLPRLTEIYNYYIRETAVTFEVEAYSVEQRKPWLAQFGETGRYRILVAERDGSVVGWANSRRFHERAAYAPTVESSIYLDPAARGQRIGTQLYGALFDLLRGEDLHRAIGGITLPNHASVALHRRLGFTPVGVMREVGRKFDRWWDVGWFQKDLP